MAFTYDERNCINANMRGVENQKKKEGVWTPDNDIFWLMAQINEKNKVIITNALKSKGIHNFKKLMKIARGRLIGKLVYNIVMEYMMEMI